MVIINKCAKPQRSYSTIVVKRVKRVNELRPVHTIRHDRQTRWLATAGDVTAEKTRKLLVYRVHCRLYMCPPVCPSIMPACVDRPLYVKGCTAPTGYGSENGIQQQQMG